LKGKKPGLRGSCWKDHGGWLLVCYGINLFYMKGVVPKDITITDICKSGIPYVGLQAVGLAIVMIFPKIAMWLPTMLFERLLAG